MARTPWRDNPTGRINGQSLFSPTPYATSPLVADDFYGNVAGGINATGNGTTLTYSFTFLAGSASGGGAIDATANGVTFTYSHSLISGAASASSAANGVTFTFSESLISGAAGASSTASGQVLGFSETLIPGAAQAGSTANGQTVSFSYGFIPGAASGQSGATANGVTLTYGYQFLPGEGRGDQIAQPGGGYGAYQHSEKRRKRIKILDDILAETIKAEQAIDAAIEKPTKAKKTVAVKAVKRIAALSPEFAVPNISVKVSEKPISILYAAKTSVYEERERVEAEKRRRKRNMLLLLMAA